jgi:hypothetical protein
VIRTFLTLSTLAVLIPLAAGCGSQQRTGAVAAVHKTRQCSSGFRTVGSSRVAWAAVVVRPTHAYRAPGRRPFAAFGLLNVNGVPTVLSVLGRLDGGCAPRWYRVELPLRPNGVVGWVRAADVQLAHVETRIVVDLSERRVVLYRRGRAVLRTTAAVGAPATPTPTGRYYVNQRLVPSDPTGPFGPGAIGISAFSDVLTGWAQGGPIAIHGTNAPWSIGHNVSNGCIRVRNDVLRKLFAQTLAGTPVIIRA